MTRKSRQVCKVLKTLLKNVTQSFEVLIKAKTSVKYTQSQWDAIQRIREHLDCPEPLANDLEDAKD
jgi:hypothetical protein